MSLQPCYFLLRQLPPVSRWNVRIFDRADLDALEAHHRMADGFEHPADLALTPFVDRQRDDRLLSAAFYNRI